MCRPPASGRRIIFMIRKLKRRFIALAMASLVVLMTVIVAGMNIINYNTVVSEADDKLTALSVNGGMRL